MADEDNNFGGSLVNNYSPKWRWIIVLVYTTKAE